MDGIIKTSKTLLHTKGGREMTSEITVEIQCDKKTAMEILKKGGYALTKNWTQVSLYWTNLDISKTVDYKTLITNSLLVRTAESECVIMHKIKQFDDNGNVIAEEKVQQKVQDAYTTNKIFELSGFKNWVVMTAEQLILTNGKTEFCMQDVEGLGLYLEAENNNGESLDGLISFANGLRLPLGDDFVGVKLPYLVYLKNTQEKETK